MTIVVPFGAGGPPDSIARVVAAGLSKYLGKPVIVENRSGDSTALASKTVARSEPNGYTLMAVDMSFAVAPHVVSNLGIRILGQDIARDACRPFHWRDEFVPAVKPSEDMLARAKEKFGWLLDQDAG